MCVVIFEGPDPPTPKLVRESVKNINTTLSWADWGSRYPLVPSLCTTTKPLLQKVECVMNSLF